jgi:hypothetical protein
MNRKEHLLNILSEECVETAQRASKALRFSLQEIQPGQDLSNADRILTEFYEAVAMVEMLQREGHLPEWGEDRIKFAKEAKMIRVEEYLTVSRQNGTLTEDRNCPFKDSGQIFKYINPALQLLHNYKSVIPGSKEHELLKDLWNKCD